jgi:hypothetical protein
MMKVWEPARGGTGRAFVGRDRELADLVAGLDDAIGGRVRLVLIAGEPGIGKTWLAEHLAEHAAKRGARVLWVRCWEGGGAPPFWPWAQLLRVLAEGLDDRTLAAWLGAGAAAQVAQLLPGLAERLGVAALPPGPVRASEAAPRSSAASTATYTCRRCASPSTRPSPPLSHRPRRMPPDQASGRHRSSTASGTTSSGWPCCDGGAALGVTRLVAGAGLSFCQRA